MITCYGELLRSEIECIPNDLLFNCFYGTQELQKSITLLNKGVEKASYMIECSPIIKISKKSGTINERDKQIIDISLVPGKVAN